jgi:hypothetical protein
MTLHSKFDISLRALSAVLLAICMSGCAELVPKNGLTEHALVTGDAEGLQAFNKKLLELENATFTGDAFIACVNCQFLGTPSQLPDLDYYFAGEHKRKFAKFRKAEQHVKDTLPAAKAVTVDFDQNLLKLPQPACPASPPAPRCSTAQWCTLTAQCDKDLTVYGCQVCQ